MNYPYSDEIMTYDYEEHRYYLLPDGVTKRIGVNLDAALNSGLSRNPHAVQNFLEEVTDAVYEYIYEDSSNAAFLEWQLACNPELRRIVEKMLLAQVKYALTNNFVDNWSGVNVVKGSAMKGRDLRSSMRVAAKVERLCRQDVAGLPFVLKTIAILPPVPSCVYHKGY